MVAVMGVVNGGTSWIPFTLISEDIRRQMELRVLRSVNAATVVAIHNMAIAAPQILAAMSGTLLFSLARDGAADSDGNNLEVWLLRVGGISTLGAMWFARSLPEMI